MKWQIRDVGSLYSDSYDLMMFVIDSTLVCRDNSQSCYPTKKLHMNKKEGRNILQKSCSLNWESIGEIHNHCFNF